MIDKIIETLEKRKQMLEGQKERLAQHRDILVPYLQNISTALANILTKADSAEGEKGDHFKSLFSDVQQAQADVGNLVVKYKETDAGWDHRIDEVTIILEDLRQLQKVTQEQKEGQSDAPVQKSEHDLTRKAKFTPAKQEEGEDDKTTGDRQRPRKVGERPVSIKASRS